MIVRPTRADDLPAFRETVDGAVLERDAPGMIAGFLSEAGAEELWMTAEADGVPAGFCYAAPETLTDGTWNLLAIAVDPARQGAGCGAALVRELERILRGRGHRILIVDTSGTDEFAPARSFWLKCGYVEEARIRDFWAAGDDKVVFWKALR